MSSSGRTSGVEWMFLLGTVAQKQKAKMVVVK